MSGRPHQNQLETEHTDEDDGESMEKFDSILDQPRCQPDVDESAENQTKVNQASWGKSKEPKCYKIVAVVKLDPRISKETIKQD